MPQEATSLNTQNAAGSASDSGFFGSLFNGLGALVTSAAPAVANIYSLQMQGDILKNQQLTQANTAAAAAAATAAKTAAATTSANTTKMWLIWGGVAAAVIIVLVLLRRRKGN